MNRKIKYMFHNYIPESMQLLYRKIKQRKELRQFLENQTSLDNKDECEYMRSKGIFCAIPYSWVEEYKAKKLEKVYDGRDV